MVKILTRSLNVSFIILFVAPTFAQIAGPVASKEVYLTPQAAEELSEMEQRLVSRLRKEGRQFYVNGAYEQAIRKFEEAYRISGENDILYDLALTFQIVRNWERCIGLLGRFLENAPASPKKDRAFNILQSCRARGEVSQTLILKSRPSGAAVYLDNRKTAMKGQTPLTLKVAPGVKRIWFEIDGYEPAIRDVEISRDQPLTLFVTLKERVEKGWLFVDSDIRDSQIYLDGSPLQLTPMLRPVPVMAGRHQVQLRRQGFEPVEKYVTVERFQLTRVDAAMGQLGTTSSWRSSLGWTSLSLGLVSFAVGGVASYYADQEYNDTPTFDNLKQYEGLGYGVGASLALSGLALIIWDLLRDNVKEADKNPLYGQPMDTPDPEFLSK
ncbi:MAG: PEGA domain-containing protein [Bradymonadia bacterium]